MDRSAPNPIPNSWREGGWEEGEENSQRKRRGRGASGDITSNN